MLRRLAAIGARTEKDARYFLALGADPNRVSVTGDLKIDIEGDCRPLASDLEYALAGLPLFVAGSTHAGEEAAALAAFDAVEEAGGKAVLALVPRHLERVAEVEALCIRAGRTTRRRSRLEGGRLVAGEVLLVDSFGELASLYSAAEVAFVGGSMIPIGGHNILEPVFAGCPVIYGRHHENIQHAVALLSDSGAGCQVDDAKNLARAVVDRLGDAASARAAAERGRRVLLAHKGAAARSEALIDSVLQAAAGPPS
jgi:3-deoxy-D-manno-octulosonic-acid transferase